MPRVVSALRRRCGQQRFRTRTSDVSQLSRLFAGLAYSATAIGSHFTPSYTACAALADGYSKPIAIAKIQPSMQAEKK